MAKNEPDEGYPKLSIHPLVDQIAMWWLLRIKRGYSSGDSHPQAAHMLFCLIAIHNAMGIITESLSDNENEIRFDPSPPFDPFARHTIRRELICDFDMDSLNAKEYIGVATKIVKSKKLQKQFFAEMRPVVQCFEDGILKPIGWNNEGRLEYLLADTGGPESTTPSGEVFVSVIGLPTGG